MHQTRATKYGAMSGIVAGVAVVVVTTTMHLSIGTMFPSLPDSIKDANIGLLALAVNIVVFGLVSGLTQSRALAQEHA
jgi:SSS family solute:Na+ symporter